MEIDNISDTKQAYKARDGDTPNKIDMEQQEPQREMSEVEFQIIKTKEMRKSLDEQLQKLKKLKGSREISLSITNLQQSIMWLGMNLKELGTENPYPNSYKPENTIVEPTADNLKL